jgi:hypothetical protein
MKLFKSILTLFALLVMGVKDKLNTRRVTFSSAIQVSIIAVMLVLMSGIVAKACGPATAAGCDINCTVQILNDCAQPHQPCNTNADCGQSCVLRTCETSSCDNLPPDQECFHPHLIHTPCGACVTNGCVNHTCGTFGCSGLVECCYPQ